MKNKNVNFIDKYIEKAVLGVAALFFLIVVWVYGLGSPYTATIGNEELTPEAVEAKVRQKADELKSRVNAKESPLPDMTVPKYPEDFRNRMDQPLVDLSKPLLALSWSGLGDEIGIKVDAPDKKVYLMAAVPTPEAVIARGGNAVLLDEQALRDAYGEVAYQQALGDLPPEDPEKPLPQQDLDRLVNDLTEKRLAKIVSDLQGMVGQRKPADFVYSSVQSDFDLSAWIDAMRKTPEENRMPETWWMDRVMVTGVILERQTLDPSTGAWGATEEIHALPGSVHFEQAPKMRAEEAGEVIQQIALNQEWILRPPFVPTRTQWLPPDVVIPKLKDEDAKRYQELQLEVNDLDKKIKRLQTQLTQLGVTLTPGATSPRGGAYDPRTQPNLFESEGPGPSPTSPRPTTPRPTTPRPTVDPKQRQQEAKNRQIEKLNKDLADLEAQRAEKIAAMDAIIYSAQGAPTAPGTTPGTVPPGVTPGITPGITPGVTPGVRPGVRPGTGNFPPGETLPPEALDPREYERSILRDAAANPSVQQRLRDQASRSQYPGRNVPSSRIKRGAADEADAKIRVYAHDLTAERGKTYRYRMRINLYNPLYKRGDLTPEQVEQNKDLFVLASDPSEWSNEVTFEQARHMFLVDASTRQRQATYEIYHVFDGEVRMEKFVVSPGDPIGGKRMLSFDGGDIEVDLSTGAFMVDINEAKEGIGAAKTNVIQEKDGRLIHLNLIDVKDDPTRMRLQLEMKRLEADTTPAPSGRAPRT